MQVFSALIVIIAGAFIITIIYRSVLSFSEPHLQTREGEELDGAGGRLPSLAMGDEEGPLWTRARWGDQPMSPALLIAMPVASKDT